MTGLELGHGGDYHFAADATFDGGVRVVRGLRVGGAGATLWRLCMRTGLMQLVAAACMALPGVEGSQVADAWGAHLAMTLVLRLRCVARRVRIFGDNLGVVRFLRRAGTPPPHLCPVGLGAWAHAARPGWLARFLGCCEEAAQYGGGR